MMTAPTLFTFTRKWLVAVALLAIIVPTQARAASDIHASNEAIVREAFDKWTEGSGTVFDLLAPDIRWVIHGSGPVADTYHGVDDFLQRGSLPLVSRLAGSLTPKVHHISSFDDRVIIRFDASATTTSGAPYNNEFVWIFRMKDGSVIEAEAFLDLVAYQDVIDNNTPRQQ